MTQFILSKGSPKNNLIKTKQILKTKNLKKNNRDYLKRMRSKNSVEAAATENPV